jgi:ketosteroid isomerase-like protein
MDHPNAVRFRSAFDDMWRCGDIEPTLQLMRDDVVWINDIGAGPFHRGDGKESLLALVTEWMALFDGTFTQELVDICASDHNVVEILHETGTAQGQRFDNLALYRYELDDNGLVTRVRTYDRDRQAIDEFWANVDIRP